MKKTAFFLVMVISVMAVTSCKSTGEINDDYFRRSYERHASGLILDGAQSYTVVSGDRMVDISRSFYNDPFYYPVIMLASKDIVLDPDKILPGMVLTIPDLQRNLNNSRASESIKGVMLDCARVEDSRGRPDTANGIRNQAQAL